MAAAAPTSLVEPTIQPQVVPGHRPRVLILENGMTVTGGFRSILAAAKRERAHFDFRFLLPAGSALSALIRAEGFPVDELPFVELGRSVKRLAGYGPALLANGWRLARLIRQHGIEVLHNNDLFNLTPYVARQLMGRRAFRLVTHVRLLPASASGPLYRLWCRAATHFADRIVCVSEAVRRASFAQEPKAVVIYEPLEVTEHHPPKTDFRPTAGQGEVRAVYVGNYIVGKGHETVLRALEIAYRQNPALRLDCYGGTMGLEKNLQHRAALTRWAADHGLADVVTFNDFTPDVEGTMKSHDLLLNCSESESFSLVCFEALQFGVPLIATDCGGPRELFEDGRSGFLVPVNDAQAVADRWLRLAADPDLRQAFSLAGKAYVRQKFGQADHTADIWRF